MTNRDRAMAVLHYQDYDRLPIVHFGFWRETLFKWRDEGHITAEEADQWNDGTPMDRVLSDKLGFDFDWYSCFHTHSNLLPAFSRMVLRERPDGSREVTDGWGAVVIEKDGAGSIPAEIDHLLKDRKSWEEHYLPRLQFSEQRVLNTLVNRGDQFVLFQEGGLDFLKSTDRENPMGLHCGSLFGEIRNCLGVEGASYLYMDDEELFTEIIDTWGDLCFRCAKAALETGARFDFAHFWEDICFKSGPLIIPSVFDAKIGPHYKRITDLVLSYGIDIVSLDCDGKIDSLIPTWFKNGVNTMFPIEVGTWDASIKPWREKYGKDLRGVGGVNKTVFARDFAAVDAEIERLKVLVDLGGFIPCPDHRLAPDAKWDNVRYYCDRMASVFG